MKNAKNAEKQTKSQNDELNLDKVKIDITKSNQDLRTKEAKNLSKKEIYIGFSDLSSEEQKKKRSQIRRRLAQFVSDILGKDRKDAEVAESVGKFLIFYKENWRVADFKLENFSQKKNAADLKDYAELLEFVKSSISE